MTSPSLVASGDAAEKKKKMAVADGPMAIKICWVLGHVIKRASQVTRPIGKGLGSVLAGKEMAGVYFPPGGVGYPWWWIPRPLLCIWGGCGGGQPVGGGAVSQWRVFFTCDPTPIDSSIAKNMTDQSWGTGNFARASGYTTNTKPGPANTKSLKNFKAENG